MENRPAMDTRVSKTVATGRRRKRSTSNSSAPFTLLTAAAISIASIKSTTTCSGTSLTRTTVPAFQTSAHPGDAWRSAAREARTSWHWRCPLVQRSPPPATFWRRRTAQGVGSLYSSSPQQQRQFRLTDHHDGTPHEVATRATTTTQEATSPQLSPSGSTVAGSGGENLLSPVLIKVVGVGGGGGNAVDGMITTATRKLAGVEFVAMNTDTQALTKSRAEAKVALGSNVTQGLGAGGKPEVGQAAAIESIPEIEKTLAGADMVFVTAGMGGGTGTGAAPVIAQAARDLGCVTVAVVTEPFGFEGRQRSKQAAAGLEELRKAADTVLVVANDRLLEIVPGRMTMSDAFLVADDVLRQGVIGTSEIIVRPGLINVDFADVREIIKSSGTALIGIGTGTGKTRAEDAAVGAMCSPLLDFPIDDAQGVIFNIVGGLDMSLTEVNAAARIIHDNVHPDANIIVGALVDERCGQQVSVTVLATGFGSPELSSEASRETAAIRAQAEQQRSSLPGGIAARYDQRGYDQAFLPQSSDPYLRNGYTSSNNSHKSGGDGGVNHAELFGLKSASGRQQARVPQSTSHATLNGGGGGGRGGGVGRESQTPTKRRGGVLRRLFGREG